PGPGGSLAGCAGRADGAARAVPGTAPRGLDGGGPGVQGLAPGAPPGAVRDRQSVVQQPTGQGGEGDGVLVGGEHLGGAERAGEVRGTVDRLQQASGAAGADDLHVPRRAVVVAGADHGALAGAVGDDDGAGVLG